MKTSASLKLLTVAAAGSCLLAVSPLVSAAASVPSATEAPAASPSVPSAQNAVTVTSKEVNDKNDLYSVQLQIPVVSGLKDEAYQTKLNEQLESRATKVLDDLKKQAAADQKASKTSGFEFRPYEMEITFSVKSDGSGENGAFSLEVLTYTYTGGAHGATVADTYNVRNGSEASPLTLEQLLEQPGWYFNAVSGDIFRYDGDVPQATRDNAGAIQRAYERGAQAVEVQPNIWLFVSDDLDLREGDVRALLRDGFQVRMEDQGRLVARGGWRQR